MNFSFLSSPVSDSPAEGSAGAIPGRPLVSRSRSALVHGTLVLFALAIVARAVQLQLVDGKRWAQVATGQQVKEREIVAPRGRIFDATGNVLVETRELVQLNISPWEVVPNKKVPNPRQALRDGLRALEVPDNLIKRAVDPSSRKAVLLPRLYSPSAVERLASVPGVHPERRYRRTISAPQGIRTVLGDVNSADVPRGGIEQELDSLLRGVRGRKILLSNGRGVLVESPQFENTAARAGHSVHLTLNQSLQEIAESELANAMKRTGATGGDVVILDPRDGAVLVMAGARDGKLAPSSTALTEPYEPGSVMKPFLVARLLDAQRTTPDEVINTENGKFVIAGRAVVDEHKAPTMAVRDVIRFSSNVGVVKLAQRLSPREQYEAIRDFGFGVFTGVPYPGESRGVLMTTDRWTEKSSSALAMGYEMSATPLQIATAYASLANGGELLQPGLVREITDAEGNVVYRHQRRVVRRVLSPEATMTMRAMLEAVVDSGTATAAELATYDVAGKSGTARRVIGRAYAAAKYNSTFAGMFPAQQPQYVFVARLIDPLGKIFGGVVSGEMVNGILQSALATRDASLDRRALAAVAKQLPVPVAKPLTPQQLIARMRDSLRRDSLRAPAPAAVEPVAEAARVVVALPLAGVGDASTLEASSTSSTSSSTSLPTTRGISRTGATGAPRTVPTVYGLDLRQAVRTLHAAGFQVRIAKGVSGRTRPTSGTVARAGTTVVLESHQ
ncbi:MAG TPA: penicillin-binding transpeptidase domain-containing protein [Gemmatimonas sp.]|nr:penicillin-binding transpeptidase domain-containing protein [Gemmatimonas sp.]